MKRKYYSGNPLVLDCTCTSRMECHFSGCEYVCECARYERLGDFRFDPTRSFFEPIVED